MPFIITVTDRDGRVHNFEADSVSDGAMYAEGRFAGFRRFTAVPARPGESLDRRMVTLGNKERGEA